jgi:hypothetical protein
MARRKVWSKPKVLHELGQQYEQAEDVKDKRALLTSIAQLIRVDADVPTTPITLHYKVRPTCGACGAPYAASCACVAPPLAPQGAPSVTSAPTAPLGACPPSAPLAPTGASARASGPIAI